MEVKFETETLKQLKVRKSAFEHLQVIGQIIQNEYKMFIAGELKKLGLDATKNYDVDFETGIISEVKKEVVIKEEEKKE